MELRIHVQSALLGAGGLGLVLLGTGAQQVLMDPQPKTVKWPVEVQKAVRVDGFPTPDRWVEIKQSAPYVVPEGSRLVIVALGNTTADTTPVSMLIDGVQVMVVGVTKSMPMREFPAGGYVVGAGAEVSISQEGDDGRIWAYAFEE